MRRHRVTMVALAAAAFAFPSVAAAETTSPPATTTTTSAEYANVATGEGTRELRPNRPLLITGGALVVFPYLAGVGVAFRNHPEADRQLFVPIAGPWMDLNARDCVMGQA